VRLRNATGFAHHAEATRTSPFIVELRERAAAMATSATLRECTASRQRASKLTAGPAGGAGANRGRRVALAGRGVHRGREQRAWVLISCLGPVDDPAAKRGMPPPTRYGLAAARLSPLLARPMAWLTARQARSGKMIGRLSKSMPVSDAEVLRRQDVADALEASLVESFRQGIGPATWDGVTVARGEGFQLEDIQPEVLIWHGEQDRNDPVAMARVQEQRLPHVRARYYPDEGHLIFFSRIEQILTELIAHR
jgi:pimeloyl-ACP methyl ester carboxylesterase